jgi:hypothetical protein
VAKKPVIPEVFPPKRPRDKLALGLGIILVVFVLLLFLTSCKLRFPLETGI